MIKIQKIEDVQKVIEDLDKLVAKKKDVPPKQLIRFDGLNVNLRKNIGELEQAIVKDTDGSYYSIKVIDGKLFRGSALTEVT